MQLISPIFLAASEGLGLDWVVWIIAGAIWLVGQIATAKKNREKRARQASSASSDSTVVPSGGGKSPTPDELVEIFKRLGADIPATPPPAPVPMTQPQPLRKSAKKTALRKSAAEKIQPVLAQRLAQAKKEAEKEEQLAEDHRLAVNSIVHGVQSRSGETRALETATQHTGAILPRLYAMSCRMAPLPVLPMPGLDRTHHINQPMRTKLHSRREVRDSLIAQTFLQPPKSLGR